MNAMPARLKMDANAFHLELNDEAWFELMHWHPDVDGVGNSSPRARKACARIAKRYLTKAMQALRGWPKASQCWCLIDPADSGQDSVYVHTENPNRPSFPYVFDEVTWGAEIPSWVADVFPPDAYRTGSSGEGAGILYWVIESEPHPLVNTDLFQDLRASGKSR